MQKFLVDLELNIKKMQPTAKTILGAGTARTKRQRGIDFQKMDVYKISPAISRQSHRPQPELQNAALPHPRHD